LLIVCSGAAPSKQVRNFEEMILELQNATRYNQPSCFVNLACFFSGLDSGQANLQPLQPTVAFATEGAVLGVLGPSGVDVSNLLSSLRGSGGDSATLVSDLSVKDALKMSEFVLQSQNAQDDANSVVDAARLEDRVDAMMAKMMLTASAQEIVGTMIQRTREGVAKSSLIEIGNQVPQALFF
jgi:ABC-type uncharacterized transport system YnjBCD ATPase subunit